MQKLVRFLAAQCVRTPAWHLKQYSNWKPTFPSVLQETMAQISHDLSSFPLPDIKKLPANNDHNLLPLKISKTGITSGDKEFVKVETILGKGMWIFAMKHFLTNTYKILEGHCWKVVTTAPGILFPTSDDSIICLNYYGEDKYDFYGGWGKTGCEILFPLSPTKILYTQIGDEYDQEHFTPQISRLIRKYIIEHAHRRVYSQSPNNDILNIHPRIVNSQLFNYEEQQLNDWYKMYKDGESDYMQRPKD